MRWAIERFSGVHNGYEYRGAKSSVGSLVWVEYGVVGSTSFCGARERLWWCPGPSGFISTVVTRILKAVYLKDSKFSIVGTLKRLKYGYFEAKLLPLVSVEGTLTGGTLYGFNSV